METRIVKLSFSSPVHFGDGRLDDSCNTCSAATLFSALYIEALRMGAADALLDAARCGALSLSDAFPYIGKTLYLPKPMVRPDLFDKPEGTGDSRERKASKKLGYIPASQYAGYLSGHFDPLAELERFKLGESVLQTKVNLMRSDSDDAEPYHVGGYWFAPGAGLYFLLGGSYNAAPLMEQLAYSGLGGKRSSGYGRFTFELSSPTSLERLVPLKPKEGVSVLLSTATPKEEELSDDLLAGSRYRLLRKGGFVQSTTHSAHPQKKRDLYLFAAGSAFSRRFEGDVFDVNATRGSHPVYRYARAMWLEV